MQTSPAPRTPTLTPLSLSHVCARYLQGRFRVKLNERSNESIGVSTEPPAPLLLLPVQLASELDLITLNLVNAFTNQGQ